jgi:hypothetical protein
MVSLNPLSMLGVVLSNKQPLPNHRCNLFTGNLCMDNSLFKDGVSNLCNKLPPGVHQHNNQLGLNNLVGINLTAQSFQVRVKA